MGRWQHEPERPRAKTRRKETGTAETESRIVSNAGSHTHDQRDNSHIHRQRVVSIRYTIS